MFTTGKSTFIAALLCAVCASPAWGVETSGLCPAKNIVSTIEVLDKPFSHTGNTCGFVNTEKSYTSATCKNPRVDYSGQDVIYKVVLNEGNSAIGFKLANMKATTDLTLALVSACGNGDSCVTSSTDFRGTHEESIAPSSYKAGTYYLYIDSTKTNYCGSYTLTVTGFNPTPDLNLDISTAANATAGEELTYILSINNKGNLDAHNVEIRHTLPSGVTFMKGPECSPPDRSNVVVCKIPFLAAGLPPVKRLITVLVKPNTRNLLKSSAVATLDEGDPTVPNSDSVEKKVQTRSDLSITNSSPKAAVAGKSMTYTLTLANAGPSDATKVAVTAFSLPSGMTFASGSPGCSKQDSGFICTVDRLKSKAPPTTITITANVKPDAVAGSTSHKASVRAVESDPTPNNTTMITTQITRLTDLAITKTGPNKRAAGDTLSYQISVENKGPSDSTKATVTDDLPLGLTFSLPPSCNASANKVTCEIFGLKAGTSTTVKFDALIDSSLDPKTLVNRAMVQAKDNATDPINTSNPVETQVTVEANLLLKDVTVTRIPWTGVDPAGTVKAGENLLYTVKASNSGPSDFRGGYIQDVLAEGLTFVSSPDGCSSTGRTVNCPIPGLKKEEEAVRRFVVRIASSVTEAIGNEVCVISQVAEHDLYPENDCDSDTIKVEREADLSVTLTDSPDAVLIASELTYTLSVRNAGPSDAAAVIADLTLPPGATFAEASDCHERLAEPGVVRCELGDVVAGDTESRMIKVLAPSERGAFVAKADVHSDTTDPDATNDHTEETTTVATGEDVDLVLTKTVDATAAVVGQSLRYELTLANQGFAGTGEVALSVEDTLPEGVTFEPSKSSPACMESGTGILCGFDPLDLHAEQTRDLTVHVESIGTGSLLNTADISQSTVAAVPDPNPGNNHASVEVPVLQAAPLVLSFAEVNADATNPPTTLFTLKNPSETDPLDVRYDVFLAGLSPISRSLTLSRKSIKTVNLLELPELREKGLRAGHVDITPQSDLAGDFIRVDPTQGTASGERLVSTDTSRTPPELCESWSVRFLRGLPAGSSTDLLFFVPGNTGAVVATGRVFAESGAFVQNVEVSSGQEAFRVSINAKDDGGLPLLAGSGSIEWTFAPGLVGNVTAVHKLRAGDEVAVPGFCRAPGHAGAKSLILPFFQADSTTNTYATVRNETDGEVQVQVTYSDASGESEQQLPELPLAAHQTWTVSLRGQNLEKGFMKVAALSGSSEPVAALSGDFIRIGPDGLAGSALVETPDRLCRTWDVHFIQGRTGFLFFLDSAGTPRGTVYDEDGVSQSPVTVENRPRSFLVSASDLGLSFNGSVEWDLGDGATGYVAMLLTGEGPGGKYAVLIPGTCRDGSPK
jgi:uncharacterized repeat protein (TIGR01451 family)